MSVIFVNASVTAKKGSTQELRKVLEALIAPSRAEEGCVFYDLYATEDGGTFVFFECWKSRQALADHENTPHYKQLLKLIGALVDTPPDMKILNAIARA